MAKHNAYDPLPRETVYKNIKTTHEKQPAFKKVKVINENFFKVPLW